MKTADPCRKLTVIVEVFYSAFPSDYHSHMAFFNTIEMAVSWIHRINVMWFHISFFLGDHQVLKIVQKFLLSILLSPTGL